MPMHQYLRVYLIKNIYAFNNSIVKEIKDLVENI